MKKTVYLFAALISATIAFTSCDSDDKDLMPSQPVETVGAYILNSGNWGSNNGTIQKLDLSTKTASTDIYEEKNGKRIGDAQHMCIYGSKLYVTCTSSAKIEILNMDGSIIKTLNLVNDKNQPINPRYLVAAEGKVYFTAQNGTVTKIDTTTYSMQSIEIGGYPEALSYANGKLYINKSNFNMDGTGKNIDVVSIDTFTKIKTIDVKLNPYNQSLTAADGNVYFVSNGNYAGQGGLEEKDWIYQTMQKIDTRTDEVSDVCKATFIANQGNKIYAIYYEYYLENTRKIFVYDLNKNTETPLPIDISNYKNINALNVDPANGDIYITNSPYSSPGIVYCYDKNGNLKGESNAWYSVAGVFFITK